MVHLTAGNSLFMPSGIGKWRVKPRSFMNSNTDCDHSYIHFAPMCSSQKTYTYVLMRHPCGMAVLVLMHMYFSAMSKRVTIKVFTGAFSLK